MAQRGAWWLLATLAALASLAPRGARAANILAILTTPTRSHHIWSSPLVDALVAQGHNLTVLSPMARRSPHPNVTDLVIEGSIDFTNEEADYQAMATYTALEWLPGTFIWYHESCKYSQTTKGVKQLFEYPDDFHFDLIIIEASGGECLLGFIEKFGRPPVVAINGFGNPQWVNWNMGNPDNPAYVSNAQLTLKWPFTFVEKLKNVGMYVAMMYYYYWNYLPGADAQLKEFFDRAPSSANAPSISETLNNVSLLLVNAHYSLDGARPFVPAAIPIAGLHVRAPKALPQELQQWLDGASAGAVYFSLGSIVRSDRLGAQQLSAFVEAFKALPQGVRVLWKWESEAPPAGLPPNVRVAKWLPQNDILAHPNTRAFITHAGMLSSHEATWRGVPLVALPFIVDQFLNAHRLVKLGVAERLEYISLTKEKVLHALNKVLGDSGYRERMRELSSLFRARERPPLETAVFWIEYVLRQGGAPRLRCATADLPWYSLWLLDVAAVVGLAVAVILIVVGLPILYVTRAVRRGLGGGKSKKE